MPIERERERKKKRQRQRERGKDKHDMFLVKLLPKEEAEISNMIIPMWRLLLSSEEDEEVCYATPPPPPLPPTSCLQIAHLTYHPEGGGVTYEIYSDYRYDFTLG